MCEALILVALNCMNEILYFTSSGFGRGNDKIDPDAIDEVTVAPDMVALDQYNADLSLNLDNDA